jgi:hypothetical protein
VTRTGDGLVVLQERTLNLRSGRERVRYTLLDPDGHRTTRDHAMRLYALTELEAMLGRSCWPSTATSTAARWSWTRASS